ncbi:hypothetical protein AALO_G00169960 [Alosa alosa]|uniref:Uncharacterized protein n=1 Tax=Alosa alosa TaxID=278164 RepID=A0AAV6GCT3_9TELE|nr:hypothetical protein AALO_G00169960 [Alosa alosa]
MALYRYCSSAPDQPSQLMQSVDIAHLFAISEFPSGGKANKPGMRQHALPFEARRHTQLRRVSENVPSRLVILTNRGKKEEKITFPQFPW